MSRILITNDDGIHSEGIIALAAALSPLGEITIIAPAREMSAAGHSLTLSQPLKIWQLGANQWMVEGTPTDCVHLAVFKLMKKPPELLVSGINNGPNLGDDVTYSGTVSAAMEGALHAIPSFAISLVSGGLSEYAMAGRFARMLAEKILQDGLPKGTFLNVNIPPGPHKGVMLTHQGWRCYKDTVTEEKDPDGDKVYIIKGVDISCGGGEGSDCEAVEQNYISITPLHLDLTNHRALKDMASWSDFLNGQFRKGATSGD